MSSFRLDFLTPEKGYIYRIIHFDNLRWHLANGVPCHNAATSNPDFVSIGSPEIIARRCKWKVDVDPYGTLADYVPFYFTPRSMMLSNIQQGRTVPRQPKSNILFLVSSIPHLEDQGIRFLFTSQHASSGGVKYFSESDDLQRIDWKILQNVDFRRDPENDSNKTNRYQAEALIYQQLPISSTMPTRTKRSSFGF